jgi:hypothetical protein
LGFVALLMQKTYLDAKTRKPIEIKVPVLGKMKTNYPALAFVFLGAFLAYVGFVNSFPPRRVEWTLTGSLKHPDNKRVDWPRGHDLALIPTTIKERVGDNGDFELVAMIDEGKRIEDVFELLVFNHPEGSVRVPLRDQYEAFVEKKSSLLSKATGHTRHYAQIPIETFTTSENVP